MKIKLRIVQGRPQGKKMVFPRGEYVFGRGAECHVRPNSDWVSRQHCLLRVTADEAFLRDLGSRNGTLINGTRLVEERPLKHGDQVQIGPLVFEVLLEEAVTDPIPTPTGLPQLEQPAAPAPVTGDTVVRALDTTELQALDGAPPPTREEPTGQAPTVSGFRAVQKR
ncbi:MAG TPA: FHA domain-containing protein [Gemmataceae bacterium]|nr:FHA domain-containing protein [Gemmataceae bacterium]